MATPETKYEALAELLYAMNTSTTYQWDAKWAVDPKYDGAGIAGKAFFDMVTYKELSLGDIEAKAGKISLSQAVNSVAGYYFGLVHGTEERTDPDGQTYEASIVVDEYASDEGINDAVWAQAKPLAEQMVNRLRSISRNNSADHIQTAYDAACGIFGDEPSQDFARGGQHGWGASSPTF